MAQRRWTWLYRLFVHAWQWVLGRHPGARRRSAGIDIMAPGVRTGNGASSSMMRLDTG